MSTLQKTTDATAFVKAQHSNSWRRQHFSFPSMASSTSYSIDLLAKKSLTKDIAEKDHASGSSKSQGEVIHPADLDFVIAARKAVVQKLEAACLANACIKASMQFRVITPTGKVKLVNQVYSPSNFGAGSKRQVSVIETDLTDFATNPVKTVKIFNEDDESDSSELKINGFGVESLDCPFSERQIQILRLLAEGKTTADISNTLFISADTVRTHRQHILQRSSHKNMTSTVVECVRKGWI